MNFKQRIKLSFGRHGCTLTHGDGPNEPIPASVILRGFPAHEQLDAERRMGGSDSEYDLRSSPHLPGILDAICAHYKIRVVDSTQSQSLILVPATAVAT